MISCPRKAISYLLSMSTYFVQGSNSGLLGSDGSGQCETALSAHQEGAVFPHIDLVSKLRNESNCYLLGSQLTRWHPGPWGNERMDTT